MEILFSVRFFTKKTVGYETIFQYSKENIKERMATINLNLHGEFDGFKLRIKMVKKQISFLAVVEPDDTSIVNEPFPSRREELGRG